MNVLFIFPLVVQRASKQRHTYAPFPPLGLVYIGTVLKKAGHKVEIIDRNELLIKNNYDLYAADKELLARIAVFKPLMVGFSATTPLMYDVQYISGLIKESFPEITTLVGGPHPTVEPEETLKQCPSVDLVAEGEGELTILDLAANFPNVEIPGLWFRKNGAPFSVGRRAPIEDLDTLPLPDRSLLHMEYFTRPNIGREFYGRYATIFSSRGCPMRCNFCAGHLMFAGKVRYHSVHYVLEEIRSIINLYHVDYIYFADDMLLADKKRVQEICAGILEGGLQKKFKWICQLTAASASLEMLRLMKRSGCILIECGFESGSQAELDRMNKKARIEKYYEFANLAHKTGMRFRANMIKGYLGQTEEDFNQSINFIKSVKPYVTHFNQFWPLPGTSAYKELIAGGRKVTWRDCTDFKQNFTKIDQDKFIALSSYAQKVVLDPLNKRNFLLYHVLRHPDFVAKRVIRKLIRHSAKPKGAMACI